MIRSSEKPAVRKKETEFWNFVNVCSVFLAFISLYTTAEGMNHFFFKNDRIHGYLISLAVQGILLSLNLRLPKYLTGKSAAAKCCAIGLYLFTVLWSSGFSYIFMSNVIYEDTWMKDAQIEMSSLYEKGRQTLAQRADEAMEKSVNEVLGDVTAFKIRAAANNDTDIPAISEAGYQSYLELFSEDAQMQQLIGAMRTGKASSGENASALSILSERDRTLAGELEAILGEITETEDRLSELDRQRTELIGKRARVSADSDAHTSYTGSIDEKSADMQSLREKQETYEAEKEKIGERLSAVRSLTSIGQMSQNSGLGQTDREFAGILAELGSVEPDIDKIGTMADNIYTTLIGQTRTGENSAEYGQLLEEYLKLRTDLGDAAQIRGVLRWLEQENTVVKSTEQLARKAADQDSVELWRDNWNQALAIFKEKILLVVPASDISAGIQEGQTGNWEYEREKLLNSLTWMQRNYLLELNEVEKAGNYLFGKYPAMAWFSLLFAVYLDTAPMLLAVFKYQGAGREKAREKANKLIAANAVFSHIVQ